MCTVVHRSDEDRAVHFLVSVESSTEAPLRKDPLHVQLLFAVLVDNCSGVFFLLSHLGLIRNSSHRVSLLVTSGAPAGRASKPGLTMVGPVGPLSDPVGPGL